MNKKAELFQQRIEQDELNNLFTAHTIENDPANGVVFEARVEYKDVYFPLYVILDDSIYGTIRLEVAAGVFTPEQRVAVLDVINQLNGEFKCFKHYLAQADGFEVVALDISVLGIADEFNPELIEYMIWEVLYPHTQTELVRIVEALEAVNVEVVAGNAGEEAPAVEELAKEEATKKEEKPRKTTKSKKG